MANYARAPLPKCVFAKLGSNNEDCLPDPATDFGYWHLGRGRGRTSFNRKSPIVNFAGLPSLNACSRNWDPTMRTVFLTPPPTLAIGIWGGAGGRASFSRKSPERSVGPAKGGVNRKLRWVGDRASPDPRLTSLPWCPSCLRLFPFNLQSAIGTPHES